VLGRGAAIVLLVLSLGAPARAQLQLAAPAARHRLLYTSLTAAQWNPLGLQSDLFAGYRYRLFESHRLVLLDTFVGGMLIARLNPAFARLGAGLELQPVTPLTLRALYEHRLYFGTAKMLQSFQSPYDAHDDDELSRRADAGENYAGHGHQITLQAVLRAKAGPVALLDQLDVVYFDMSLRGNDRLFYVNLFDTLCPRDGFVLANHGHLVYLTGFGLIAGVRYTLVHAFYPEAWIPDGNPNTPTHRIGPIVAYTFKGRGQRFSAPTLILILNWWVGSRYRSGAAVSQALPYGVVAFQFSGDLWRGD
jgi:hypothetical protein